MENEKELEELPELYIKLCFMCDMRCPVENMKAFKYMEFIDDDGKKVYEKVYVCNNCLKKNKK